MGFSISSTNFERRGLHVEHGLEVGPALYKHELERARDSDLEHLEVKGRFISHAYVAWVREYLGLMFDAGWFLYPNSTSENLKMVKDTVMVIFNDFELIKENYGKGGKPLGVFKDVHVANPITGKSTSLRLEVGTHDEAATAANAINAAAAALQ